MDSNNAAIEASHLTKFYGSSRGIIDLNLSVPRGEIFGFLGPNGSGKTTTIRLFLNLISPSSGSVFLLERKSKKGEKALLQKIGYLSGEIGLYHDLTGIEYLRHLMKLRSTSHKRISWRKMTHLVERFNIDLTRKTKSYSSGMKRIVAIIQAFMHDPILLILDEPTRGLDPLMQERFHDLLREEKNGGTTIFLSSHNLREVEKVCDRVGVIKDGRLIVVEEIEKYRTLVGKKVSVATKRRPTDVMDELKKLSGVENLTLRGAKVEFFYKGTIPKLIQHVAALEIEDLTCETPSLEDVFIRYYKV